MCENNGGEYCRGDSWGREGRVTDFCHGKFTGRRVYVSCWERRLVADGSPFLSSIRDCFGNLYRLPLYVDGDARWRVSYHEDLSAGLFSALHSEKFSADRILSDSSYEFATVSHGVTGLALRKLNIIGLEYGRFDNEVDCSKVPLCVLRPPGENIAEVTGDLTGLFDCFCPVKNLLLPDWEQPVLLDVHEIVEVRGRPLDHWAEHDRTGWDWDVEDVENIFLESVPGPVNDSGLFNLQRWRLRRAVFGHGSMWRQDLPDRVGCSRWRWCRDLH